MSILRVRRRSIAQPRRPIGIEWSNPITRALNFAFCGSDAIGRPTNRVSGASFGPWHTNSFEPSTPVVQVGGTPGAAVRLTHDSVKTQIYPTDTDSTLFVICARNDDGPGYTRRPISVGQDGTGMGNGWSQSIGFLPYDDTNARGITAGCVLTSGGTAGYSAVASSMWTLGAPVAVASRVRQGNDLSLWVNGVNKATTSVASKTTFRTSNVGITIGASINVDADDQFYSLSYPTEGNWFGDLWVAFQWNRALSDAEIASVSANPWQLFEPDAFYLPIQTGGGSSTTTVTVDAGTLSLTGQSVTDTVTAAVGAGTVTLTGQNVALQQQQPVTAGSASLTGQSIGVTITVPISPGTLSLTGSGVTVVPPSGSVSVAVDPGTLTLTGQSVTSLTTVPVSAASSSLTGQNIGVTTTITVEPGSITLTGQAVAVNYIGTQTITVDPGTLSLSGRDVTVTVTGGTKGGIGKGKNFTLKQKKKLKQVVNQEWLKAEQTAKELLYERLGHAEPAKTKVERLTTVQSLGDVIAALQALSKETVTLPEQQAVIKSFEKSIDTKIVKTGERLVYVEDKVNETLGRIEKKIQNLEDLLIVIIDDLL